MLKEPFYAGRYFGTDCYKPEAEIEDVAALMLYAGLVSYVIL